MPSEPDRPGPPIGAPLRRLATVAASAVADLPVVRASWRLGTGGGVYLASHMAFMLFFAMFPFLIFLTTLAGFFGSPETAGDVVALLFRYLPPEVVDTLAPAIGDVLGRPRGGVLTLSIAVTLWIATSSVEAMRAALNHAYGDERPQPFWRRRLQALAVVIVAAVVAIVLSATVILAPLALQLVNHLVEAGTFVAEKLGEDFRLQEPALLTAARYAFGFLVMTGLLLVLHRVLPNQAPSTRRLLPGAVLTSLLWLASAALFTLYLSNIARYSVTYGPLGGVVATLIFFQLSALLFVFGAEFNAARDAGPPPGKRLG